MKDWTWSTLPNQKIRLAYQDQWVVNKDKCCEEICEESYEKNETPISHGQNPKSCDFVKQHQKWKTKKKSRLSNSKNLKKQVWTSLNMLELA